MNQIKILTSLLLSVMSTVFFLFAGESFYKEIPTQLGQTLIINLNTGGNISIIGWEKNTVAIQALFAHALPNITIKNLLNGVVIKTNFKWETENNNDKSSYTIYVPKKYDINLDSIGGNISIKGVIGHFQGKTMGGDLKLSSLTGDIQMKTMGGNITLADSTLNGKVKTMGGWIRIENCNGNVTGTANGGSVIYKNKNSYSDHTLDEVVNLSTMDGDIHVNEARKGARVQTMDGDIYIKTAKEFVVAKTINGNITIQDISGWIKGETLNGNVWVKMTGNPKISKRDVQLSSLRGNITLLVPEELSMFIDIQLTYTKENHQDYSIMSDFKLEQEKATIRAPQEEKSMQSIRAKGIHNGGIHHIRIQTTNGNIILRKNK